MSKGKKSLKGVMEWKQEYGDKLNEEETKWISQFYHEYEGGQANQYDEPILTTTEQIKEARRNYNTLYRDGFNVSKMLNVQESIDDSQQEVYELASDEIDWETAYNQQGEVVAAEIIMIQTIRDLDAGQDKKVVLSRFYVKMRRLSKTVQQEKRKQR